MQSSFLLVHRTEVFPQQLLAHFSPQPAPDFERVMVVEAREDACRGLAYEQKKMYVEALREMQKAKDLLPVNLAVQADIGHVYAASGDRSAANRVLAVLKRESASHYVNQYELALIYAGLGQNDQAFACLSAAYRERADMLVYLNVDPRLGPLRSDPRFADLVRRVGIPE